MKKIILIFVILTLFLSCTQSRKKDVDELVLSEFVYENTGIYYQHAVNHKKVKYSGILEFYYSGNGKLKGKVIIKDGIPDGHWKYWYENGSERMDIHFENGKVVRKIKSEKKIIEIEKPIAKIVKPKIKEIKKKNFELENLWNNIIFKKGGCLTGSQYYYKNQKEREGSVLNKKEWKDFLSKPKKELTLFLITKFKDTVLTDIHTCPFFRATNGEIAVYALQKVHNKNWFEFEEFKKYKNKETSSATDNRQSWLQEILKKDKTRKALINNWLKEINKK